jgi:hypothetical protein
VHQPHPDFHNGILMTAALSGASATATLPRAVDTYGAEQSPRWMCPALVALAAGVALTALLGLLTVGAIRYHLSVSHVRNARLARERPTTVRGEPSS